MSKTEHLSIMADFILLAAQQLRAAVEPFRCDTFGCETAETDALDKACAEVDRVMDAGLLDAAKKSRESALAAAVQAEREACARAVAEEFSANNADSRRAQSCALRAIRSRPAPAVDVLDALRPRPLDDWHEDIGEVLWWKFPLVEPPYVGSPLSTEWPGYHTHWTPIQVPLVDGAAAKG